VLAANKFEPTSGSQSFLKEALEPMKLAEKCNAVQPFRFTLLTSPPNSDLNKKKRKLHN